MRFDPQYLQIRHDRMHTVESWIAFTEDSDIMQNDMDELVYNNNGALIKDPVVNR